MGSEAFFKGKISAVNVGAEGFCTGLREQNVKTVSVKWRPPVDARLIKLMRRCDEIGLTEKIDAANQQVLQAMLNADPVWIGIRPAREVVPGFQDNMVLHSGPECGFDELCALHRKGVVGAALHEKWAATVEEAEAKFRSGELVLGACNDHATVGAGAGIVSPSMPVLICRDENTGREGYCLPFEGRSGLGVWGVYNEEVEKTLQIIEKRFSPAVDNVLREQGGIPIKSIIARSLQMNDDIHTRQTAAGLILLSEIAPKLLHSDLDRNTVTLCVEMFAASERWFHPLGMASAMSTIRGIKGLEYSTVVTAICNGGVNTGLKVAALGEQWFTAPAPYLKGAYFSPAWSEKDASPYCGDSTITEVVGMGAFAGAAAPSVLRLRGGTCRDAVAQTTEMRTICVGINTNYPIPMMEFTGPGLAIDVRKVIETGIAPVCHGGIISKEGGQIGAGIARFPIQVYIDAMYAFLKKYGLE